MHMHVWGSTGLASSIALRLLCRDKISQLKLKLVDRASLASSSSLFHGLTGGQPHAAGAYVRGSEQEPSHCVASVLSTKPSPQTSFKN